MSVYSFSSLILIFLILVPCKIPTDAIKTTINIGAKRNWSKTTFFRTTVLPLEPMYLSRIPYHVLVVGPYKLLRSF